MNLRPCDVNNVDAVRGLGVGWVYDGDSARGELGAGWVATARGATAIRGTLGVGWVYDIEARWAATVRGAARRSHVQVRGGERWRCWACRRCCQAA